MDEKLENHIEQYGFPIVPDEKSGALQWIDMRELRVKFIISVEKIKPFFEGLKEGKLLATKCKKCGRLFFPPQKDCPSCRTDEMDWVELSKEGQLETLTVLFVRPPSFANYDPYTVAIAKLDDGPRITAWLKGDPTKARPGMKVRVEVSKRKEGYYMYELVPVE
ncbi:putative nucleic-acid-binding protein containing a Zn-ribbon [Archaeoglobus sulfaticallidus PM70-1]|uniref:Putative nucleic-acid-binding protein containing a Zn-ribbon n=1 Tax=Archaeoglobus sulfaticallidus PM70-1 TaxID=387631 RepID=N0BCT0_9EURY|nr:Zn-ribbon domain-containing OB-fold protein [Archaeoglobus sulfaticallidus]AGK61419.1 putative nucleic-acid-binding protein containing a Zn-ribbon [Archaeoglobus sulfaticallidus PM70-1]